MDGKTNKGVFNPKNLNMFGYTYNNPVNMVDPDGKFALYAETEGTGHIGIQTNQNGNKTNYDFGRYKGKYSESLYSGPAISKRSGGKPSSSKYEGYQKFDFKVSQELDNAIATKFEKSFESGKKALPQDIKSKLSKKSSLNSNERYSGKDWGLTGPNCLTNTLSTLKEGLEEVKNSEKYGSSTRNEASKVFDVIDSVGTFTFTPSGAKSELIDAAKNHDFIE